jgi:hypothetical protein
LTSGLLKFVVGPPLSFLVACFSCFSEGELACAQPYRTANAASTSRIRPAKLSPQAMYSLHATRGTRRSPESP